MNDAPTRSLVSSRSLKRVAGGVSLLALAFLAMLAVGLFTDGSEPDTIPSRETARDAEVSTSEGQALHAAIAEGDSEMVRILVDGGADVDSADIFGEPALHAAIDGRNREMVRILVEAGADVDAKNNFGDPALHMAISEGDSESVRTLVEAGANVRATNAFGDSALSRAVQEGNSEILEILTEAGGS